MFCWKAQDAINSNDYIFRSATQNVNCGLRAVLFWWANLNLYMTAFLKLGDEDGDMHKRRYTMISRWKKAGHSWVWLQQLKRHCNINMNRSYWRLRLEEEYVIATERSIETALEMQTWNPTVHIRQDWSLRNRCKYSHRNL